MWLILLEAGIAAGLLIAIVMWTMSGRHESISDDASIHLPTHVPTSASTETSEEHTPD